MIQVNRKHHILNSKAEYNRCALPRLSLKMGDSEYKELKKNEEVEKGKEEALERKIRELRKVKNRARKDTRPLRNQPIRKRRKIATLELNEIDEIEKICDGFDEKGKVFKRGKEDTKDGNPAPNKIRRTDIRSYYDKYPVFS